jgi:predicted Rossmann fold nucleotide-binding protein DprA/Smf involved in DNA uptake
LLLGVIPRKELAGDIDQTNMFDPIHIDQQHARYPQKLRLYFADRTLPTVIARGHLDLLHATQHRPFVALFCSIQCSEPVIQQTYALAHALRDAGVTVISGFHSPLEKECLGLLLQGTQPVIVCPARSIERLRLPVSWRMAIEKQRLLLLSPFGEEQQRPTSARALVRNQFIAALADVVVITHATPGGKSESFCHELYTEGKPLFALDTMENTNLFNLGAEPLRLEEIKGGGSLLRKLGAQ